MAFLKVNNVAIRGISACVPKNVEENRDLPFYGPGEAEQVIAAIGIERRHITTADQTASDLCYAAAENLIAELGWEKESIDLVAFCTQTGDYLNYPNSFVAHNKLGLSNNTICIDTFHGCPGWVVTLSSVASMLSAGVIKRAILLDGDTCSREIDASNREERPLFGDAGTAVALEYDKGTHPIYFNIETHSEDGIALIHPHGGYRHPYTIQTLQKELDRKSGSLKKENNDSKMDSMDVFSFAITKVPKSIKQLCQEFDVHMSDVDFLVLHQANKLIVDAIAKRIKMPEEKVPLCLREYGNTTSASIPLTMVSACTNELAGSRQRILISAFGTGLSCATAYLETENIIIPPIQLL